MTIHLKYYLTGSIGICLAVFIGGVGVEGGGRGGGVFGSISCSCSTFIHCQSLTRSLTSFMTIYIVYELASFKTIISTRSRWVVGGSRGGGVVGVGVIGVGRGIIFMCSI